MQARCARAGALQHLGKLEEAEEEFTLALQIQPTLESFCVKKLHDRWHLRSPSPSLCTALLTVHGSRFAKSHTIREAEFDSNSSLMQMQWKISTLPSPWTQNANRLMWIELERTVELAMSHRFAHPSSA